MSKKQRSIALDSHDHAIVRALQANGRMSNVELAEHISLSESATLRRVRALEQVGLIEGYSARIDQARVGLPGSVFINITLQRQDQQDLEAFEAAVQQVPEIMECYLMTGESDYLLRVVVPDIAAYQAFLLEHLTRIEGIASIKSSFALKQVKYKTALPLDHLEES